MMSDYVQLPGYIRHTGCMSLDDQDDGREGGRQPVQAGARFHQIRTVRCVFCFGRSVAHNPFHAG